MSEFDSPGADLNFETRIQVHIAGLWGERGVERAEAGGKGRQGREESQERRVLQPVTTADD